MMRRTTQSWARRFAYGGTPVKMSGDGRTLTSEVVRVRTEVTGPMSIHAVSGYISTLYFCCYDETKEVLMLDTGMPGDAKRAKFFIEDVLKLDVKSNLKTVVSTHCHVDHVGASWDLQRLGAQDVVTTKNFERYYAGIGGRTQQLVDACLAMLVGNRLGRVPENPFVSPFLPALKPHRQLEDGVFVPNFPDWVAISCPGHTGHMVMLYHQPSQILYAADFFIAHKNEFRAPVPVDIDYAYEHTLRRLRRLDVRYVLLAHGGIVDVEDVGGWASILDDVAEHRLKEDSHPTLRFVRSFLLGFTPEPRMFTSAMLPRGPLPSATPCSPSASIVRLR